MNKFLAVFKFYLTQTLFAKSTVISSIVIYFIIMGIFGIDRFAKDKEDDKNIAFISSQVPYSVDLESLNEGLKSVNLHFEREDSLSKLKKDVKSGKLDGIILLEKQTPPSITYIYKSYEDSECIAAVSQRIQQAYIMKVIDESKADPEIVNKLLTPVKIKKEAIKDTRETFGIVYSFVFLMYIFIATFGQMIASSIASEKSSRVIEVIISKVKPIYMMYAKILAILFAGLTQFFIIMLAFGTSYLLGWFDSDGLSIFGLNINLQNLSLFVIVSFLIYFILGFLLYALLYAAVGATVSRTEDLSSGLLPIIILVMCALFIGMKSLFNPSSDIVVISSYIPVFSPIVTFSRIMVGEAGYGEIGLTLLLLVCSIFFMNRLVSIIYVNSVTNYRGKLKMKELVQVVRKGIEM